MPRGDATTISRLKIVVTQDADGVAEGLTKISHSLTEMRNATKGGFGKNIDKLADQIEHLASALEKIDLGRLSLLNDVLKNTKGMGRVSIRMSGLGETTRGMNSAAEAAENAAENTLAYADAVKSASTALGKYYGGHPYNGAMPPYQFGGGGGGRSGGGVPPSGYLGDGVSGFFGGREQINFNSLFGEGHRKVSDLYAFLEALSRIKFSLGDFGTKLKSVSAKLSGFWNQLKRIAMYRAIRFVLKQITQSISEGVKNLYAYSKLVGTTFAPTMDNLATSALYLKNSLGAVFGQIIEAAAPLIIQIADGLAEINNEIAHMIAMLRGQETYSRALKVAKEYDDTIGKIKATLLGFDEINRMNGADSNAADYTKYFEEAVVNEGRAKQILDTVLAVGAAIAAWRALNFIKDLNRIIELIGMSDLAGTVLGKIAQVAKVAIGLTISIAGLTLYWDEGKLAEDFQHGLKQLVGAGLGIAGMTLAFGEAGLILGVSAVAIISLVKVVINWDDIMTQLRKDLENMGLYGGKLTEIEMIWDKLFSGAPTVGERLKSIGDGIKSAWDTVVNAVIEGYWDVAEWVNKIKRWWNGTVTPILDGIANKFNSIVDTIQNAVNELRSLFMTSTTHESSSGTLHGGGGTHDAASSNGMSQFTEYVNDLWRRFWLNLGINVFAGGGFPEDGLFFANSGEMVGKFSNGKTVVANNAEITAGIAQAVYGAITEAGGIGGGDWTIELVTDGVVTGQKIITAAERANRRNGKTLIAVG